MLARDRPPGRPVDRVHRARDHQAREQPSDTGTVDGHQDRPGTSCRGGSGQQTARHGHPRRARRNRLGWHRIRDAGAHCGRTVRLCRRGERGPLLAGNGRNCRQCGGGPLPGGHDHRGRPISARLGRSRHSRARRIRGRHCSCPRFGRSPLWLRRSMPCPFGRARAGTSRPGLEFFGFARFRTRCRRFTRCEFRCCGRGRLVVGRGCGGRVFGHGKASDGCAGVTRERGGAAGCGCGGVRKRGG